MDISFDLTDFLKLADDLDEVVAELQPKVRGVVAKGAVKVKAAMRADMAESRHFGQAARTISYDSIRSGAYGAEVEIGPVKGGPGSIANIAYFGGARGGGTVRDPQEALDDEADPFEKALFDLLGDL